MRDAFDQEYEEQHDDEPRLLYCKRCESQDVRWRQQGGKWVLFSLTPGVPHRCEISTDAFQVEPEIDEDEQLW